VFYRPRLNQAEVRELRERFEDGELTGAQFHQAVRRLATCIDRSSDPTYQPAAVYVRRTPKQAKSDTVAGRLLVALSTCDATATELAGMLGVHTTYVALQLNRLLAQGAIERWGPGNRAGPYQYSLARQEAA
jgi:hypothetical protein